MVHFSANQVLLIVINSIVLNICQVKSKVEAIWRAEYDRLMDELISVVKHTLTAPFPRNTVYNGISDFT